MPYALELGLKQFAHVLSNGIFGEVSANEMQSRAGNKFEMRLFQDINAAKSWLGCRV